MAPFVFRSLYVSNHRLMSLLMPQVTAILRNAHHLAASGREVAWVSDARLTRAWQEPGHIPGCALQTFRRFRLTGLVWVLILGLASAAGSFSARGDSSPPDGRLQVALTVGVMSPPLARGPRIESGPTIRSGRSSKFSESAHLEELDGDDDDPILVPSRPLARLAVLHLWYLIDSSAELAPAWIEPPSSSSRVVTPLRC